MRLASAYALAIVFLAMAFETECPRCTVNSPRGVAIGGVLRIAGCP